MMANELIAPHGGKLTTRLVSEQARTALCEEAATLAKIVLGVRELSDLEMLASGAYSPLQGFMGSKDYHAVVWTMHLSSGLPWTIPITLSVTSEQAVGLKEGQRVALIDAQGSLYAVMTLEEIFPYNQINEALQVYRTDDPTHTGVQTLFRQGPCLLGGPVEVITLPVTMFSKYQYSPGESRRIFAERGWKRVAGFQTRNPVHRAHEYIQKCALEMVDGLFLHPLVGETRTEDIPADIRIKCYEVLLDQYYPSQRVLLGVMPASMRYAGPREAIFHALIRKNYGCTHFIVGRDHAGIGSFYGTYDAQWIFSEFDAQALAIEPLFFEHTFYCQICGGIASSKTCPHEVSKHLILSGTKVRQMLRAGQLPPPEFTRPEVARVLSTAMKVPVIPDLID
ncbi:MAG TPA: sulfate adenylyltransferase [Ktedonobacteraceae bacterium]|nr:sulfate adenylyltransferase [Ktedonobacteraceae bacterium]